MAPRYNLNLAFKNKSLLVRFFPDDFLIYPKVERRKKNPVKDMFWFVADISWICLPYVQRALSLHSCLKYRQPKEREDTKREKWRDSGRGEEAPSSFLGRAVQGSCVLVDWQAAKNSTGEETRASRAGRLPLSSARPASGQFISLSLKFPPTPPPNSKLGTIPRWGKKEEDGESFKKINRKNKPKVSPVNPEHA